jgi:hypothetical protein
MPEQARFLPALKDGVSTLSDDEYLNTLKVPLDGYDAATSLTSASAPDEPQSDFKC